jgi:phosphate starvation-inducible PhoH-like protein
MSEKDIVIEVFDPRDIYGVNEANIKLLKDFFPKLKVVVRGDTIRLIGDEEEINRFDKCFEAMMRYYEKFGMINEHVITELLSSADNSATNPENGDDILVHGRNGNFIRAKTPNQRVMVSSIRNHDMLFAIGPAGSGKTYTAVALAVRALKNKEVKRIILTRPAVEAGENLGFLPGDLKDKLDPYLQPLYDALWDMLPAQKLKDFIEEGIIEIAPLAFMRGRTLDHAFVILDEAQNATIPQMKMFLTRMGKSARFIITGDITQVDLPRNQASGLIHAAGILKGVEGIAFVMLDEQDIIRHGLVTTILRAYNNGESK